MAKEVRADPAELAKLAKLKGQLPDPLQVGPTNALLASTITF